MSKNDSSLTCERLKEVLHYSPETGEFQWKVKPSKNRTTGCTVGTKAKSGYLAICIDYRIHLAHRLAWLYVTGFYPSHNIDHIDGDKLNNRFSNLRDVPQQINLQNQRGSGLGTSLKKGKYRANIGLNGVTYHLGTFATQDEAHDAYLSAKRLFHPGGTL